jgi:hypothetical protein
MLIRLCIFMELLNYLKIQYICFKSHQEELKVFDSNYCLKENSKLKV